MLSSYAAWMFWICTSVVHTGQCAASPGYGGSGKVTTTCNMQNADCSTIPDRFVCGGGRRITTVVELRVA